MARVFVDGGRLKPLPRLTAARSDLTRWPAPSSGSSLAPEMRESSAFANGMSPVVPTQQRGREVRRLLLRLTGRLLGLGDRANGVRLGDCCLPSRTGSLTAANFDTAQFALTSERVGGRSRAPVDARIRMKRECAGTHQTAGLPRVRARGGRADRAVAVAAGTYPDFSWRQNSSSR